MHVIIFSTNLLVLLWHIVYCNTKKLQDNVYLQYLAVDYLLEQSMSDTCCGILSKWQIHTPKTHTHTHTYMHTAWSTWQHTLLKYHGNQHYLSQVKMDSDVVPGSLTMTFSQYQYCDLSLASQRNSTFCSFPRDTASTWNVSVWCRRQRKTHRDDLSPAHYKCR